MCFSRAVWYISVDNRVSSTNIGELAQSGERALHRGEVRGSNPLFSTMLKVRGRETSIFVILHAIIISTSRYYQSKKNHMNEVNKTLYIPLYGKSKVSQQGIILNDPSAEIIWKEEAR